MSELAKLGILASTKFGTLAPWIVSILIPVLLLIALAAVSVTSSCKSEDTAPLIMVLIPAGEALEEAERYQPIINYLSDEIGREIELRIVTDYTAAVQALKVGKADIARLGPFTYILATEQTAIEPIAVGVKISTGKAGYYALIVSGADTGITEIKHLEGVSFAFVDHGSASGYVIPNAALRSMGIETSTYFSDLFFAGSHPAVIEAVKRGKVDAGAIADNRYEDALRAGVITETDLNIVYKSGLIPGSPTVVRADMDTVLKSKLQQAYLNMPSELAALAVGKLSGYIVAVDSDYDFLRELDIEGEE